MPVARDLIPLEHICEVFCDKHVSGSVVWVTSPRRFKMPAHDRDQGCQQQVEHADRQQVFPFQVQQLINPGRRGKVHWNHMITKMRKKVLPTNQTLGDIVHDMIKT